ncbi:unnamed protein product [marine sediment metagenome]|uniref:Uncharacterized protein n=1 Tax=marine sediment metagenome TaxID=412755 RepID=X1LQK6_9ZZZZ
MDARTCAARTENAGTGGSNLVVWIKLESTKPVSIKLTHKGDYPVTRETSDERRPGRAAISPQDALRCCTEWENAD